MSTNVYPAAWDGRRMAQASKNDITCKKCLGIDIIINIVVVLSSLSELFFPLLAGVIVTSGVAQAIACDRSETQKHTNNHEHTHKRREEDV